MIGALVLGLAIALPSMPSFDRLASSARNFRENFHNLKSSDALNSVERFVFSLVLAKTESHKPAAPAAGVPRT